MKNTLRALVVASALACTVNVRSFSANQAPQSLSYPPIAAFVGQALAPVRPKVSGAATLFTSQPSLPPGLLLDGASGTIAGTPVVPSTGAFSITASNASGFTSALVTIDINNPPPALTFAVSPYVFAQGEAATTGTPANAGGPYSDCAMANGEKLPPGLALLSTCEISGSPIGPAALATYDLLVIAAGGNVAASVALQVNAPVAISPPTVTLPGRAGATIPFTATGGTPPLTLSVVGDGTVDANDVFTSGIGSAKVVVSDAAGQTASAAVTNQVNGAIGNVAAVAFDVASNALYFAGNFSQVGFISAPSLLAINRHTGDPDYLFDLGNGFDGKVEATAVAGDAVYVGGDFAHYRGHPAAGLAKLSLSSGQLDRLYRKRRPRWLHGDRLGAVGQRPVGGARYRQPCDAVLSA